MDNPDKCFRFVGGEQNKPYNSTWNTMVYDMAEILWKLRCNAVHWNIIMESNQELDRINTLCLAFEKIMDREVHLYKASLAREEGNKKRKLQQKHSNNQNKAIKGLFILTF
jgi:hypothetical protein